MKQMSNIHKQLSRYSQLDYTDCTALEWTATIQQHRMQRWL